LLYPAELRALFFGFIRRYFSRILGVIAQMTKTELPSAKDGGNGQKLGLSICTGIMRAEDTTFALTGKALPSIA
jgi:hypothetical protein